MPLTSSQLQVVRSAARQLFGYSTPDQPVYGGGRSILQRRLKGESLNSRQGREFMIPKHLTLKYARKLDNEAGEGEVETAFERKTKREAEAKAQKAASGGGKKGKK